MHVRGSKENVELLQERQGSPESAVCGGLVDHLLDGHGRQSSLIGYRQHHFERVESLTANQSRENRQGAGLVVQIGVVGTRFVYHFVIGEIGEQLDEFRVGLRQRPIVVPKGVHLPMQFLEHVDILPSRGSIRAQCHRFKYRWAPRNQTSLTRSSDLTVLRSSMAAYASWISSSVYSPVYTIPGLMLPSSTSLSRRRMS